MHVQRARKLWQWLRRPEADIGLIAALVRAHCVRTVPGPVSLAIRSLEACEAALDDQLQLHTPFGVCNFLEQPWSALRKILRDGWHRRQATSIAHREQMRGVGVVDAHIVRCGMKKFSAESQGLLRVVLTCARFDGFSIHKYQPAYPAECPHCGELDTREHRILTCTATAAVRERFHALVAQWASLPVAFRLFLLSTCPDHLSTFRQLLLGDPQPFSRAPQLMDIGHGPHGSLMGVGGTTAAGTAWSLLQESRLTETIRHFGWGSFRAPLLVGFRLLTGEKPALFWRC